MVQKENKEHSVAAVDRPNKMATSEDKPRNVVRERKPLPPCPETKPDQVDRPYYERVIGELDDAVKALQTKQKKISDQISGKSEGKEEFFRKRDVLKAKLDEFQNSISELEGHRTSAKDNINSKQTESRKMRSELNEMKKKLGYQTELEIDNTIAEVEYKMHTETLSLKKEKEYMKKISDLKCTKPKIKKYDDLKNASGAFGEESVGPLRANLEGIKERLSGLRDSKKEVHNEYSELMENRKKTMAGMTDVIESRDKLNKSIKEKINKIRALRDERSEKLGLWASWVADQKEKRAERERAEKEERAREEEDKKIKAEEEKEKEVPFLSEIELVEATIKYCNGLLPKEEVKESAPVVAPAAIAGTTLLQGKKARMAQATLFQGQGKKSVIRKDNQKKTVSHSGNYTHSIEILGLYSDMNVNPPMKQDDLPKCIKDLEGRLSEIKKKQSDEYKKRDQRKIERENKRKALSTSE